MKFQRGALVVAAHPNYYPHIERHYSVLLERCDEIVVICVGLEIEFPKLNRVKFVSAKAEMPVGVRGFLQLMKGNLEKLNELKPDLVEAIDPPALGPAAWYSSKRSKKAWLFYMSMEYYTEQPNLEKTFIKKNLWKLIERYGVKKSQERATVNSSIATILGKMYSEQFAVIRNVPPLTEIEPAKETKLELVYHGRLEEGRGLESLCDYVSKQEEWNLKVIGNGPLLEGLKIRYSTNTKVRFLGRLPYEKSLRELSQGGVGAVFIEANGPNFFNCLPGKIFECLQMGLPILVSELPELKKVVLDYQVGEIATQGEDGLKNALDRLQVGIKSNQYSAGLAKAQAELNWESERKTFLKLIPFKLDTV